MSSTVLDNANFFDRVRGEIGALSGATIDGVAWERFQQRVKGAAIAIGRQEARDRKAKLRRLADCLRSLVEADEERPGEFSDMRRVKQDIRSELERQCWGALVRSRK